MGVLLLLLLLVGEVPAAVVDVEGVCTVLVHQNKSGLVREMRTSAWGRKKQEGGAGDDGVDRNRLKTVAELQAPARDTGSLGARMELASWGKWRGALGGFYRAKEGSESSRLWPESSRRRDLRRAVISGQRKKKG